MFDFAEFQIIPATPQQKWSAFFSLSDGFIVTLIETVLESTKEVIRV